MSLKICGRMLVLAVVFSHSANAAWGQRTPNVVGRKALLSQTVSVSTLQIPAKAWKYLAKAQNAADHNRPDESLQQSTRAIVIAPNFSEAYLMRASEENRQHRYDDAIADVTTAIRIEPEVTWASVLLAGAYNGTHRYKDALLSLDESRGSEAETWQAKYERARAEIGSGDVEAALYWSALALEAAPRTNSDVHLVRMNAFLIAQRWKDAQSEMKIYLESKNSQAHRNEVLKLQRVVQARIDNDKIANAEVGTR